MCGIVGAVCPRGTDPRLVEDMRDRLAHRGPDAAGLWSSEDGRVCLGHRRLAIVDLSPEANQPFVSADGRYVLTLNGEIYNFRQLRRELEAAGAVFRTRSDTEVLLETYRRHGPSCVERLSGMFAFAIWDERRGSLFCARDRAGEKPFYYARIGDSFLFASELKSLLLWPGFRRELNGAALADFLSFGYVPDPKTIWAAALKLPPAHTLAVAVDASGISVGEPQPYWDLRFAPEASVSDWGSELRAALLRSAQEMAYADVPVGTFLSGGVDSSSVTAALTRSGYDAHAFTIGFEDQDFDERPFARQVASLCRSRHTERTVAPDDVEHVFRSTVLWHYDEPFGDYSYLPTYYVCREARGELTVALTGDGADELFAGYGKYSLLARRGGLERTLGRTMTRATARAGVAMAAGRPLGARLRRYALDAAELLTSTLVTGTAPAQLRQVARGPLASALAGYDPGDAVRPHLSQAPPAEVGLINAMRYLDLKLTLGAGILTKVDRAAMAVSLETRPVYLNRALLELAGRIPAGRLADATHPKKALREALRPWLPASVLDRPKMGFAMPLGRWLRGDLTSLAEGIARGPLAELIDPGFTTRVVEDHLSGVCSRTAELHNLVFLGQWLQTWLVNPAAAAPLVK